MDLRSSRTLIAEDNIGLARVLQFNLERVGLNVTVAYSGTQAWEAANETNFDLVITDHEMPGMTGIELCTRLRGLPQYEKTPMVMVTARELELDKAKLERELGMEAVFAKPYSPSMIVDLTQRLLESLPESDGDAATGEKIAEVQKS